MSETIRSRYVEANGLRFEVDTCGDGPELALCLHGFPELNYSWRAQLPVLAELGYTAWAPNMRGYGGSSRPKAVKDYALPELVADVAGLIDAAGRESTVLIGHDWGGAVAWAFALRHERPLDGLIALNIPHPELFLRGIRRFPQIFRSWYIFFFQLPWLPELVLRRDHAAMVARAFRGMTTDPDRFPDEVVEVYRRAAMEPGAARAMINYYRALFRHMPSAEERATAREPLDTPTLLIWGEQDSALGKELTFGTEELVTDLTLRYLPNASHWVQQDAPDAVNAMIAAWLRKDEVPEACDM